MKKRTFILSVDFQNNFKINVYSEEGGRETFTLFTDFIKKYKYNIEIYVQDLNLYFNYFKEYFFNLGYKCKPYDPEEKEQEKTFSVLSTDKNYYRINFGKGCSIKSIAAVLPHIEIGNTFEEQMKTLNLALKLGVRGTTMGSSVYNAYGNTRVGRNALKYRFNDALLTEDQIQFAIKSYSGGICLLNDKMKNEKKKSITVDINSAYCYFLLNECLPFGEPKNFETIEEYKASTYKVCLVKVFVYSMKLKEGFIPIFGIRKSGKDLFKQYVSELENTFLYMWSFELRELSKYYDIDGEVKEIQAYKTRNGLFNDFINKYKEIKETTTNPIERKICKTILNNIIGKFASRKKLVTTLETERNHYETFVVETNKYYISLASFINAKVRTKMMNAIELFNDKFIYCDTDSITFEGEKIPKWFLSEIDQNKFGKFKLESTNVWFKAIKPKCYQKEIEETGEIKTVISGIPKSDILNIEKFEEGKDVVVHVYDTTNIVPVLLELVYTL